MHYARGYYYAAKSKGLLRELAAAQPAASQQEAALQQSQRYAEPEPPVTAQP
jgi:hypothetical protein